MGKVAKERTVLDIHVRAIQPRPDGRIISICGIQMSWLSSHNTSRLFGLPSLLRNNFLLLEKRTIRL